MSDDTQRPLRPQYGEYATPEEQRARISEPEISWPEPEPAPVPSGPALDASTRDKPVTRPRRFDRIVTFALLAYGLINVIGTVPALADYVAYSEQVFGLMGLDVELSNPISGQGWALAAALTLGVGWLITAVLAWLSVRAGRRSWWIPLVGGFVFMLISAVLILIPMISDPAVQRALAAVTGS